MEIAQVNPLEFTAEASRILTAAWAVPSIHYSVEYLRWQFSFPGPLAPIGVAAFDGGKPVGFAGAMNRRLRLGDVSRDVYLMSFLSVLPEYRGAVAFGLMREFTEVCMSKGQPVASFSAVGGLGEKLSVATFASTGFTPLLLNQCKAYGGVPRVVGDSNSATESAANDEELSALLSQGRDAGMVRSDPTAEQRKHYANDPRGSAFLVTRDSSGVADGYALVVCSELTGKEGITRMAAIDSVHLPAASAAQLSAIVRGAAQMWKGRTTLPMVLAPNLAGVDPQIITAAGLRELPSAPVFQCHLFLPSPADPFAGGKTTNLEVV